MKKLIVLLVSCFIIVGSAVAMATNVGIVDMQSVFKTSKEVQHINALLEKRFSKRREDIVKLGKELEKQVKDYRKNQSIMDSKKSLELQQNINKKSVELSQKQAQFRSDLATQQNVETKPFLNKLKQAVEKVAKDKDLSLVLPSYLPILYYAKDKLDITADVKVVLNKMSATSKKK